LSLALTVCVVIAVDITTKLDEWVKLHFPWWHSENNRFTNWVVNQLAIPALVVLTGTYVIAGVSAFIFARSFLVVESFISLRSLPKGSFKTVPWSNYWPHF
jgi:predicted ABC-type sugar transport system permease subunit